MLVPRMTTTERDLISTPAESLLIYNTTTDQFEFRNSAAAWEGLGGVSYNVAAIYDATGTPTYYSSLQAAITAASAGEVVQVLSDITETGTTEIILKDGVNINGNGHTYTNSNAGANDAVTDNNVSVSCKILNWSVVRTGGSGYALHIDNASSNIEANGSDFSSNNSDTIVCEGTISNAISENTGTDASFKGWLSGVDFGTFINCTTNNTSIGFVDFEKAFNCTVESTGVGYKLDNVTGNIFVKDCYSDSTEESIISTANGTLSITGGDFNSVNQTAINISTSSCFITGSKFFTSSSVGSYFTSSSDIFLLGTSIYSAGGYGIGVDNSANVKISNCNITSDINYAGTFGTNGVLEIYNSHFKSNYNNLNGHAIRLITATNTVIIKGCVLEVTNVSAYSIWSQSAETVTYIDNTYKGSPTTPVHANVTQGATNTEDNYGNILI